MSKALHSWEREFRQAAAADDYSIFREHLSWLNLPDKPELLVDGTIKMVYACKAYAGIDGQSFTEFLAMQRYNPNEAVNAKYALTFNLCNKAFARVLVPANLNSLDLADIYGHPWDEYKVCGYNSIWITRADWTHLTKEELVQLEQEVTDDLSSDYSEDELDVWFDGSINAGDLFVHVQDHVVPD